jgi:hypothetical protein
MGAPMTPHGLPSDLYHCLLDEQPYYLVPPRLLRQPELFGTVLVNPDCWFSWDGPLPPDKAEQVELTENFLPSDRMVWVQDSATHAIWPFWVGDEYFAYLHRMAPGRLLREDLPFHVRWVLTQANILVGPDNAAQRRQQWDEWVSGFAATFEHGYVVLENLIHPFHLGALRRYYRHRMRRGFYSLGDEQVSRRFASHNEGVARFIHRQLAHAISDVSRATLKPSYAYFVSYLSGADLKKHVDREQCEYSITTCIDASPEPRGESPWPIELDTGPATAKVYQAIGDALFYRGCSIAHWRERLPQGLTSTSLLLHYVDESFTGNLD